LRIQYSGRIIDGMNAILLNRILAGCLVTLTALGCTSCKERETSGEDLESSSRTSVEESVEPEKSKPELTDAEKRSQGQRTGSMDVILITNNIRVEEGEPFEIELYIPLGEGVHLFGALESTHPALALPRPDYDWIKGWEPQIPDGEMVERPGGIFYELSGEQHVKVRCTPGEGMPEGEFKMQFKLTFSARTRGLVSPKMNFPVKVTLVH
jgi:hypothetical protein